MSRVRSVVAAAWLAAAGALQGCAAPPVVSPPAAAPVAQRPAPIEVDDLIRIGCYRCLEEAYRHPAATDAARFQIATLLGMRAKELGLPYRDWLGRAAELMPLGDEWPLYLEVANVVRVDPLSGDREEILGLTADQRRQAAVVGEWREALKAGAASPIFRAYLDITLACSAGQRQEAIEWAQQTFPDVPLIQYRVGTCGDEITLAAVREGYPEYADADFPLGRNALESTTPDQEEALRRFAAARQAFPASPLIAASIGDVHREREEWAEALAAYEATLALVPTHRDALLGRTIALSNLGRYEEAIASATEMLDLGNWFIGAAYFWRAWNHYNMGQIGAAADDIEQARARGRGAATLVLSGMVAWRQQRLQAAERDFQDALDVDRGQCEAAALQGGVRAALNRFAEALSSFQHAQQCFDLTIALRRKLIEDIEQGPGSTAGKAGQVARHQRALEEAERHRDDATQNAAAMQKRVNPGSR